MCGVRRVMSTPCSTRSRHVAPDDVGRESPQLTRSTWSSGGSRLGASWPGLVLIGIRHRLTSLERRYSSYGPLAGGADTAGAIHRRVPFKWGCRIMTWGLTIMLTIYICPLDVRAGLKLLLRSAYFSLFNFYTFFIKSLNPSERTVLLLIL